MEAENNKNTQFIWQYFLLTVIHISHIYHRCLLALCWLFPCCTTWNWNNYYYIMLMQNLKENTNFYLITPHYYEQILIKYFSVRAHAVYFSEALLDKVIIGCSLAFRRLLTCYPAESVKFTIAPDFTVKSLLSFVENRMHMINNQVCQYKLHQM